MEHANVVTEEPLLDRPEDVVTSDGPSGDEPAVHEDDGDSAGDPAAAAESTDDSDDGDDAGDESDGDEDGQDSGEDKPPRQQGKKAWQKSVDRLTRQRAEERRLREESERIAAEERGRRMALEELIAKGVIPKPMDADAEESDADDHPEPQPEDFDTVEEYARAYSKWEREAEAETSAAPASTDQQEQAFQPSRESANIREASYKAALEAYPDIEERMNVVGPQLSIAMVKAIEFDEDGASIVAALADHPEDLKRLASLTDEKAVSKAMQRFAGKVLGQPAAAQDTSERSDPGTVTEDDTPRAPTQPRAVPVSRAAPVGTVLSGRRVSSEPDLEGMDQGAYEDYMNRKQFGSR